MASLAASFWGSIWSAREPQEESISPDSYYGEYTCPPSGVPLPLVPSIEVLEETIVGSNNSAAGPDGIPFAAWRSVARHAAPVLFKVLSALAGGELPPDGYNDGLLFLLPKKGTLLPDDTRPISVTNSDNRIIAKAVVRSVSDFLFRTLLPNQKGFIPGRSFEDHIRELNELFYKMVESEPTSFLNSTDNFFVLFMDTAKAFDSVDHSFILESIKRIGLPPWFSSLVTGLLHSVRVKPAFKGASDFWIDICRGVKQGCPLSPLLFVICYDVLLRRLDALGTVGVYACADDLALSTPHFINFWAAMRLVDSFSSASGLGVNRDKTMVIGARPSKVSDHLPLSPWPDTMEVPSSVYLGILFGREVTTNEIFEEAQESLSRRASLFSVGLKALSHANRVLTVNVFIVTKLSYLCKFFHVPYTLVASTCVEGVLKRHAQRLIVRFGGTAYSYEYLVALPDLVSPGPPLRDVWAASISNLATTVDLSQWNGVTSLVVKPEEGNSLRMTRHALTAAQDFVSYVLGELPEGSPFVSSHFTEGEAPIRRKRAYNLLVEAGYREDLERDLLLKLRHRGLSHCAHLVFELHLNYSLFPSSFPPHIRGACFDILANAVPTGRRTLFLRCPDPAARAGCPRPPCLFCGLGEDSVEHVFDGSCEVVVVARAALTAALNGGSRPSHSGSHVPRTSHAALAYEEV